MARLENNQTGIGFLYQAINGIYDSVFKKLDDLIVRWEKKKSDFEEFLSLLITLPVMLMHKLKSKESRENYQFRQHFLLLVYRLTRGLLRRLVKSDFDLLLNQIKLLKTNSKPKVTDFLLQIAKT